MVTRAVAAEEEALSSRISPLVMTAFPAVEVPLKVRDFKFMRMAEPALD